MTQSQRKTPAVTLSVRIPKEMRGSLEALADATGRNKSYLAAEAIGLYLAAQAWQIESIQDAIKKADRKNAKFVDHASVINWLKTWGAHSERKPPNAD